MLDLAKHPEFIAGNVHTNFIRDNNDTLFMKEEITDVQLIQGALTLILTDDIVEKDNALKDNNRFNPFVVETGFRVNYLYQKDVKLKFNEKEVIAKVRFVAGDKYSISADGSSNWMNVEADVRKNGEILVLNCNVNGELFKAHVYRNDDIVCVFDEV